MKLRTSDEAVRKVSQLYRAKQRVCRESVSKKTELFAYSHSSKRIKSANVCDMLKKLFSIHGTVDSSMRGGKSDSTCENHKKVKFKRTRVRSAFDASFCATDTLSHN